MAPMSDEERLIYWVAKAHFTVPSGEPTDIALCEAFELIEQLRIYGVTLTPPPAPEPTYTRTFTEREWAYVINALDDYHAPGPLMPDGRLLVSHMSGQQPDPEPGA